MGREKERGAGREGDRAFEAKGQPAEATATNATASSASRGRYQRVAMVFLFEVRDAPPRAVAHLFCRLREMRARQAVASRGVKVACHMASRMRRLKVLC